MLFRKHRITIYALRADTHTVYDVHCARCGWLMGDGIDTREKYGYYIPYVSRRAADDVAAAHWFERGFTGTPNRRRWGSAAQRNAALVAGTEGGVA